MKTTKDVGERVTLYPDGKYRWVCEVNMLKNPSILFDVWKVLGISIGILVAFFSLLAYKESLYILIPKEL